MDDASRSLEGLRTSTILVVEDEMVIAMDVIGVLRRMGYCPLGPAADATEALEIVESGRVDLALMDIQLRGGMDGIELAAILRRDFNIPVVYITSYADEATLQRAKQTEPAGYVQKPVSYGQLRSTIEMALYKHEMDTRLRESEERFATTLNSLAEAVFSTDARGVVDFMNPAAVSLTGRAAEIVIGRPVEEALRLVGDRSSRGFAESLASTTLQKGQRMEAQGLSVMDASGQTRSVDLIASPIRNLAGSIEGMVLAFRDASHEAELERQLLHAQKMEAIGVLAGGIAHDFNNILAAVIGFAEVAAMRASDPDFVRGNLDLILKASRRARDLVNHILTFGRKSECRKEPIKLAAVIRENLKMLRASLPATIEIREQLEAEDDVVRADSVQMGQVLMNLGANAAHAMPGGGTLTVRLDRLEPRQGETAMLRLLVADTGHGAGSDVLRRMFEPFFTTKKPGEGTGMGLSVVHGIVTGHGGTVSARSEPGKGTEFTVLLPAYAPEAARGAIPVAEAAGGAERILFVDDEPDLTVMAAQMLGELGYSVTTAGGAAEALRLFRQSPRAFDLIIADQTMPRMTGLRLIQELRGDRPELPAVLCTGFSEAVGPEAARAAGVNHYVMKPLFMADLSRVVREALNS